MILVDFSQILISNVMQEMVQARVSSPELPMFRHMVLNSLRAYRRKFGAEYGELVICCDGIGHSWRKDVYPYYKASRKKTKSESKFDWAEIYRQVDVLTEEVSENFPYKVVKILKCEGDDVIAIITRHIYKTELMSNILILSGDKDFQQLQRYAGIQQFDPVRKRWIKCNNPQRFLVEHIARGDVSDSIPNCYSSDDTFVTCKRQKSMTKDRLAAILDSDDLQETLTADQLRNYHRNESLISFKKIPEKLVKDVIENFETQETNNRSKLVPYFVKNGLKVLFDRINDF
jgi:hypothetical protein